MLGLNTSSQPGLADAEAMSRLARGDIAALAEAYRRHAGAVSGLLCRLLPGLHRQDVEDLTQEVFITLFETAQRYREEGKLRSWLFGIAAGKARNYRRRNLFRLQRLREIVAARGLDHNERPSELRLDLEQHLRKMPHEQREVLVMYELEAFSGEEIASLLGVPLNTVWTRLRRARARLVSAIEAEGSAGGEP